MYTGSAGHPTAQPAYPQYGGPPQGQPQPQPGYPIQDVYGGHQGGGHQAAGPGMFASNNQGQHQVAKEEWPMFQGNEMCIKPVFNIFPANRLCKKKLNIPLTIFSKPLGRLYKDGVEIPCPISDIPQGGSIVRCTAHTCRAYVNAFALWQDEGRRWKCPNCHRINDLVSRNREYFIGGTDEYNRRRDRWERPELCSGTMEFVAPQEYTMRPPMRPTFCFLIDVTKQAVQKGVVDAVCNAIKAAIDMMQCEPGQSHERAQVMIATFDCDTHVYQLPNKKADGSWTMPTVLTHPGACEPYPISSHTNGNIVVEVQDNKERIKRLLDIIPTIWRQQSEYRSGLGASLKEIELYLSKIGGRVLTFFASRPSIGSVNCTVVADGERMQAKSEAMLKPANPQWKLMGTEMAQDKEAHCPVGVELYAFSPAVNEQSLDLPTLLGLPAASGSHVYQFDATAYETIDQERLIQAVTWSIAESQIAWECCVRVRVSKGWKIPNNDEGWNHFDSQEIRDSLISYPCLGEDASIAFNLEMIEPLSGSDQATLFHDSHCHVQVALLYTTTQGSRRIRLHSIAIPVTSNSTEIWQSVNPTILFRQLSFTTLWNAKFSYLKALEHLHQKLDNILASMRVSQYAYADTVIRDIATYALGLTKTDALREVRNSNEMTPDTRVALWYTFQRMMTPESLLSVTYPYHCTHEEIEQFVQRVIQGNRAVGLQATGVPVRR